MVDTGSELDNRWWSILTKLMMLVILIVISVSTGVVVEFYRLSGNSTSDPVQQITIPGTGQVVSRPASQMVKDYQEYIDDVTAQLATANSRIASANAQIKAINAANTP